MDAWTKPPEGEKKVNRRDSRRSIEDKCVPARSCEEDVSLSQSRRLKKQSSSSMPRKSEQSINQRNL